MKKFYTFGKVLGFLIVIIVIALFTRKYWGKAVGSAIRWICASLGVNTLPTALLDLLEKDAGNAANQTF
jgi:galactitol-specific phosphotransferase system IIC component